MRRLVRIFPVWAWVDSAVGSGIVTSFVDVMVSSFATWNFGPFFTVLMLS